MALWTFVRHGESEANAQGWLSGMRDPALTERGREQAIAARGQLEECRFVRVFASDLQRASETARLLLAERSIEITEVAALRERSGGAWEGRDLDALKASPDYELLQTWTQRPPQGESLCDSAVRALRWLARHDDEQDTLVVAHGALIRSLAYVIDKTPRDAFPPWRPGNCEFVARSMAKGAWAECLRIAESEA